MSIIRNSAHFQGELDLPIVKNGSKSGLASLITNLNLAELIDQYIYPPDSMSSVLIMCLTPSNMSCTH